MHAAIDDHWTRMSHLHLTCDAFMFAVSVAVMSVDLGSEWMKMAIVKPGVPMEIVLNKYVMNIFKAVEISNLFGPSDVLMADPIHPKPSHFVLTLFVLVLLRTDWFIRRDFLLLLM